MDGKPWQVEACSPADGGVVDVLAAAFREVPLTRWVVREPDDARLVRRYIAMLVAASGPGGLALREASGRGAALWVRPGAWRGDLLRRLRHVPRLARIAGPARSPRVFQGLSRIAADHPEEPHYYLEMVGVRSEHRGSGLGGALLAHGLEHAEAEGCGAYLHTSSPAAVPLYRKLGFEVVRELRLPAGGPRVLGMWRERPGAPAAGDGRLRERLAARGSPRGSSARG